MDPPYGKFDAAALQSFTPGEDVLVNTIHQRAIKIEKESR
jgi:hypothetical protein